MEKDTSRIEAFSDGIFAVAITLLAIEIGVDIKGIEAAHAIEKTTNSELLQQLIALWPKVMVYFNSFASVLLMWMSHHQIFKLLRTTDNKLILANGLLLLIIALVPFPTKTMGEFIRTDAQQTAIVFYTGYSVITSAVYVLLISVAGNNKRNLFLSGTPFEIITSMRKSLWIGFILCAAIFSIAFFAPVAALILNFCMWIFWAVLPTAKVKTG